MHIGAIHWELSTADVLELTLRLLLQIFLQDADAAVFNLSLLTSDFFAVVAAKYLFDEELSWLYFVGFSLIIAGILVYNNSLAPTTTDADDAAREAKEGTTLRLLPVLTTAA